MPKYHLLTISSYVIYTSFTYSDENDHDLETSNRVRGVVLSPDEENENYGSAAQNENNSKTQDETSSSSNQPSASTWKINIVLFFVSCWYSMALTGWGSIQGGGNMANPDVHNVSMWMIVTSQWIMYVLYLWSLVAPKLFPDRDFS